MEKATNLVEEDSLWTRKTRNSESARVGGEVPSFAELSARFWSGQQYAESYGIFARLGIFSVKQRLHSSQLMPLSPQGSWTSERLLHHSGISQ